MRLKNFAEGLAILLPYFTDPDGFHLGAEHDQIFIYATDRPVSEEDVAKLRALEWFQPDADEAEEYDPRDGWSAFV